MQRVSLSSGRFAMIDDGLGFQLVPFLSDGRLSCALCKGTARLAKRGKHSVAASAKPRRANLQFESHTQHYVE
jgi:hypothetical protein